MSLNAELKSTRNKTAQAPESIASSRSLETLMRTDIFQKYHGTPCVLLFRRVFEGHNTFEIGIKITQDQKIESHFFKKGHLIKLKKKNLKGKEPKDKDKLK